jgi:hypothetical protein
MELINLLKEYRKQRTKQLTIEMFITLSQKRLEKINKIVRELKSKLKPYMQ